MEIGFVNGDAENGARQLAELLQLLNQIGLGRKFADATNAKRLVDAGHEKDQLQLSAAAMMSATSGIGRQQSVRAGQMSGIGEKSAKYLPLANSPFDPQ